MLCGQRWKLCDCPWFNEDEIRRDYRDDLNIPARESPPAIRARSAPMPLRRGPRNYPEEVHLRRSPEQDDGVYGRSAQLRDDYMSGGLGAVHGIGNAAGHFMNEHYQRPQVQRAPVAPPPAGDSWRARLGIPQVKSSKPPLAPRPERVVGARLSRAYEDEAAVHAPIRRTSQRARERPKSSDLAGLNVPGRGMNRVSQWRNFVEPGVPDGESTVGHV